MSGCCDICIGPVLFAQGVTGLATRSQDYLSYKLTGSVLLAQGITGLVALGYSQSYLSNSRPGLACSRSYWSCSFAHRITYLATHRRGLAYSRDYWSYSPRLLTDLPVL